MEEYYDLLKIGLTEGETKVYLALSKLGSSTVGPIVKESKVAYSNIYDILNRLIEKGIVSFIIKQKTKYFQAASPSNLVEYLNKKEKELQEEKQALKEIIPDLEKLQESKESQEAEVFLGVKGLRTAYEKMYKNVKKGEESFFFYIHKPEYAKESNLFYKGVQDLVKHSKIKGLCNKEYKHSWFAQQAKYMKLKFVNFPIPANIDIVKNYVFIVSWKPSTVGILIHSQSIADTMRNYFYEVWDIARKSDTVN